jgi:hypothetical protein
VKLTLGKTGNPPFAKKRNRRGNRAILAVGRYDFNTIKIPANGSRILLMISASPIRIGTANFAAAAARAVSNVAPPMARTNPNGFGR